MSYQQTVEAHHKVMYSDNVKMVAQQMQNPLRAAFTIVDGKGEAMEVADLLGKKRYRRSPDRDRTNPDNPTPRSRRWIVRPEAIEDGEYLDKADLFDAALDPSSNLLRNCVQSVEMGVYDAMLGIVENDDGTFTIGTTGLLGSAKEGKRGTVTTAFPASQIVAAGGAGLTMAKLRDVNLRLKRAHFGLEVSQQTFGLITPKQADDLIGIAVATGSALNGFDVTQLREGKPTRLMGIDWIVTNRVPVSASGARQCVFWNKDNALAGFWQDVQGRMWNDPSKKNLPYMFCDAYVDATRAEDAGVFIVECVE